MRAPVSKYGDLLPVAVGVLMGLAALSHAFSAGREFARVDLVLLFMIVGGSSVVLFSLPLLRVSSLFGAFLGFLVILSSLAVLEPAWARGVHRSASDPQFLTELKAFVFSHDLGPVKAVPRSLRDRNPVRECMIADGDPDFKVPSLFGDSPPVETTPRACDFGWFSFAINFDPKMPRQIELDATTSFCYYHFPRGCSVPKDPKSVALG